MKSVYISGQISGLNFEEAYNKFEQAESYLKSIGKEPINPMKIKHLEVESPTWEDFMLVDLEALFFADEILMLDNWRESLGAHVEFHIAGHMEKKIGFHKGDASGKFNVTYEDTQYNFKKFPMNDIVKSIRALYVKTLHDENVKHLNPLFIEIMKYCKLEPTQQN